MHTINIGKSFNLFIFPSDFQRCSDLFFILKTPEACLTASDSRQAGCTHPTLHPQGDRLNMTTQDPKKQNL